MSTQFHLKRKSGQLREMIGQIRTFSVNIKLIVVAFAQLVEHLSVFSQVPVERSYLSDFIARVQVFGHMGQVRVGIEPWPLVVNVFHFNGDFGAGVLRWFAVVQGLPGEKSY